MDEEEACRGIHAAAVRLFSDVPGASELYAAIERHVTALGFDVEIRVGKTQVSFSAKRAFAWAWFPIRRVRGRPDVYVVLSFGLRRRVEDARIVEACEPRPGRWTHHVLITGEADLESPVRGWLLEAYRQAGGEA